MKKRFTVYGNCQAAALASQMLTYPAFAGGWEYVPLEPNFQIGEDAIRDWTQRWSGKLDLIVAHELRPGWREGNSAWDIQTVANALGPQGRLMRYADMYFRGVNPLLVYPRTFARLPHCDYTDIVSLTLTAHGLADPALAAAVYRTPGLLRRAEIDAVRGLAELELSRRERNLEIHIAEQVARASGDTPVFHTFNHPTNRVLDMVARQVLDAVGVATDGAAVAPREFLQTVRFPLPDALDTVYGGAGDDKEVLIESGDSVSLQRYFELTFEKLAVHPLAVLRQELDAQRLDAISGLMVQAVERCLADRMSMSPATLAEVGQLNTLGLTPDFVLHKADPQATGFMVDLMGMLRQTLLPRLIGQRLSVLDLGAKSGAGSELLAYLGQNNSFSKLKFEVTCADIDPTFKAYSQAKHPHLEYLAADVFSVGRQWDVVICSHVVEHVPDPLAFVERLRSITRRHIVLAFPYMEDPNNLIPGHLHSLGHDFLRALAPARYEVYEGLFWSQSLCCVAVLDLTH